MYDKAIKDMEANTGIYDFVYIEQDIIYSYLSRNFLVDITKSLKDNPKLASPDFKVDANFTSFINYFKNADGDLFGVPMEAFVKVYLYRKDLFGDPKIQEAFKAKYGYDLPRPRPTRNTPRSPSSSPSGARITAWSCGAPPSRRIPAIPRPGTSSSKLGPDLRCLQLGHRRRARTTPRSVANGGSMNGREGKAALEYWLAPAEFAPPESTQSTWDEVAATFAAGRAAQGLVYGENAAWIATNADKCKVVGNVGIRPAAARRRRDGCSGSRHRLYRLL